MAIGNGAVTVAEELHMPSGVAALVVAKRLGGALPSAAERSGELLDLRLGNRDRRGGGRERVGARVDRLQLRAGLAGAGQQLLIGLVAKPPFRIGDPVELALHLLEAVRLRLERGEERAEVRGGLA